MLVLIFSTGGMIQQSSSGWVEDGVDWTIAISQDYLQAFIANCSRYAVQSALKDVCEDLEFRSCQKVAQEVRDSYSYQQYYCEDLGSIFYKAAKAVVSVTAKIAWFSVKSSFRLIGYAFYYSGYALVSSAQYLLE